MKIYNKILPIIFILFLVITITGVSAQNTTKDIKNQTKTALVKSPIPTEVKVGIYVLNLGKFDISTGSFTADFYLSFKCNKKCPEGMEYEFMNGRAASLDKIIDEPNEKFYRVQANLNSPVDLKRFPFDTQKMQIIIEDKRKTIDYVVYSEDVEQTGIDESVIFVGWDYKNYSQEVKEHYYPVYDETYSQYSFNIPIKRSPINAVIKTLLPIIFIILVMLSSFILDPDKITTRIAMVGSALVASVMFHVSLANQIPPVGYLTFIDKFMVLTYFIILLSFGLNVMLMELTERKKIELVNKIHGATEFTMFIIVPISYALLFIFLL